MLLMCLPQSRSLQSHVPGTFRWYWDVAMVSWQEKWVIFRQKFFFLFFVRMLVKHFSKVSAWSICFGLLKTIFVFAKPIYRTILKAGWNLQTPRCSPRWVNKRDHLKYTSCDTKWLIISKPIQWLGRSCSELRVSIFPTALWKMGISSELLRVSRYQMIAFIIIYPHCNYV